MMGDNKYGQLGRSTSGTTCQSAVQLVDGILGEEEGSEFRDIKCGWSHRVVSTNKQCGSIKLFGWGQNDKGQLGLGVIGDVSTATLLANVVSSISSSFSCGAESTVLVDEGGRLYGCGWNELGNLGNGDENDSLTLHLATGARIVTSPLLNGIGEYIVAAGGAHVLAAQKRHQSLYTARDIVLQHTPIS